VSENQEWGISRAYKIHEMSRIAAMMKLATIPSVDKQLNGAA
jgi:hypothetical protein